MSKNIETFEIRMELFNDLLHCYRKVAPMCFSQTEAYDKTVNHKAKRFYLTPKQAYQRINMYIKGRTEAIDSLKPLNRRRFYDLMEVVNRLSKQEEYKGYSLVRLCGVAVLQPAPCFYLDKKYFSNIFLGIARHGKYDKNGRDIIRTQQYSDPKFKEYKKMIDLRHKYVK